MSRPVKIVLLFALRGLADLLVFLGGWAKTKAEAEIKKLVDGEPPAPPEKP